MDIFSETSLTNKLNQVISDFQDEKFNSQMVQALISRASEIIPPYWSLKNFIAVNPLKGFENKPFLEAAKLAKHYFNGEAFLKKSEYLQYLDKGEISLSALNENLENMVRDLNLDIKIQGMDIDLKKLLWEIFFARDLEFKSLANPSQFPYSKVINSGEMFISVNNYMIKFLEHFFDEGVAAWGMPLREKGLYLAWKNLAIYDSELKLDKSLRNWFKQLPDCPEKALIVLLDSLGIDKDLWEEYLKSSLAALPGWTAFIKWRHLYAHIPEYKQYPASKLEYLVIRLTVEAIYLFNYFKKNQIKVSCFEELERILNKEILSKKIKTKDELDRERYLLNDDKLKALISNLYYSDFSMMSDAEIDLIRSPLNIFLEREPLIWLSAWEDTVHKPLAESLYENYKKGNAEIGVPLHAQMVFCIDVRSEGIRRCIEADKRIETFGFAGFFGLPVAYKEFDSKEFKDSCPVLIKPKHQLAEKVHASSFAKLSYYQAFKSVILALFNIYKALKINLSSAFILAEASGPLYMLIMLIKSLSPSLNSLFNNAFHKLKPQLALETIVDKEKDSKIGFTKKEQLLFAEMVLRLIGLTENFAPLVVFCGHGSSTENNHFASALECGACAANHGGNNAKALAQILNKVEIREELKKKGINIPAATKFIGAEHNTTTDEFSFYEHELVGAEEEAKLVILKNSLELARLEANQQRYLTFTEEKIRTNSVDEIKHKIKQRSLDWSEPRPEWGLAGNHSFIIAPREISKGLDLGSSAFMHSYNWREDESAVLLETIMTAPMVVTQWINNQYYFSTVDNVNFGSASKITHNIVGNIGVMQGNASDLFTGLSLQSLMSSDTELYHKPLRLRVFILAPLERVKKIIKKNTILQNLFYNEWIKLIVLDPLTEELSSLLREDHWKPLKNAKI